MWFITQCSKGVDKINISVYVKASQIGSQLAWSAAASIVTRALMLCGLYFYRARIISRSCNFYVNSREQQSLKSVFKCRTAVKWEVEKEIFAVEELYKHSFGSVGIS